MYAKGYLVRDDCSRKLERYLVGTRDYRTKRGRGTVGGLYFVGGDL
jgi:hypothetical protein